MDQKKIGLFLKELRKEKNITQEVLAEKLNVSNRSVSRWETGNNLPDISLLVELSEFYHVSISEIVDGERKSEKMNQETKDTAVKMAEYSKNEVKTEKKKVISSLLMAFGAFIMISAFAIFPNDSSWGSIYSILGGMILVIGFYFKLRTAVLKKSLRIISVVGCICLLFGIFTISDYLAVSQYHQVPRFSYEKIYSEDQVEHRTLFYTVIQKNPGTENESVEIVK
ncbi:MAG: helix-turn-helix transcriptional regulator [Lachnospiraceae bacterium]|nr:helix-turn-helix transcriptional regulator [Lachnospiraceae bacterium]